MKTLKHLALCLAAAFIATGCSNDENEPVNNAVKKGTPATFNMTISNGANTRTSTNSGRVITWRAGDEVGIFAIGGSGEPQINCKYVYNAETLMWEAKTLDNGIMLEEGANYTFYAYYPYTDNVKAAKAAILNVYSNQSITQEGGNSNYDLSDVLLSQSTVDSYNNGEITLNYTHAYAMVEVLIAGNKIGEDGPSQVVLKNVVTDASIDLTTQEINTLGAPQDVIMARVEGDENNNTFLYRAIVPAQKMTKGSTLLEVYGVNGGKNYTFKAPENKDIAYDKGKFFRMEVMIGEVEAGIKFPGGNIDPWESTPGVNLEGEEIKVQLIKEFTGNDLTVAAKVSDLTEEGWYAFQNKADNGGVISVDNLSEATIDWNKSLKLVFTSTWNNETNKAITSNSYYVSAINYTHIGPIEIESTNGLYKITFKAKGTVTATTSIKSKCNIACVSGKERGFGIHTSANTITGNTPKSTMAGVELTSEWPEAEYTVFVNFSKVNWEMDNNKKEMVSKYSGTADLNTPSETDDLSKFHLRFYTTTNANKDNLNTVSTLEITDVKMEPYVEEKN